MKLLRFAILFLVTGSCIDPFDIKTEGNQLSLVVDGMITDQPGPYTVKLSRSRAIEDQADKTQWETGATITLFEDGGTTEKLKEVSPGNYETVSTQGVIGNTYHIQILTADGSEYDSTPEKLLPVGDFENLHAEFSQKDDDATADPLTTRNGFNIFLDAHVLPEQQGLVRWRWTGTFEILTYPELQTKAVSVRNGNSIVTVLVPDPPACSGFLPILDSRGRPTGKFEQRNPCTCCNCWIDQYNDVPLISNQDFITNSTVSHFNVAFVQANRRLLYSKYNLKVDQMSVSPKVFDFWQKIRTQKTNGGDLFQTPPAATAGNIEPKGAGLLPVIGVFGASSIKSHTIIIHHEDVPYYLPPIDSIKTSCTLVYKKNTTITKPSFW